MSRAVSHGLRRCRRPLRAVLARLIHDHPDRLLADLVRLMLQASLGSARIRLQVDAGFGDAIVRLWGAYEVLADPTHEEHEDRLLWVGEPWRATRFDAADVDRERWWGEVPR